MTKATRFGTLVPQSVHPTQHTLKVVLLSIEWEAWLQERSNLTTVLPGLDSTQAKPEVRFVKFRLQIRLF